MILNHSTLILFPITIQLINKFYLFYQLFSLEVHPIHFFNQKLKKKDNFFLFPIQYYSFKAQVCILLILN